MELTTRTVGDGSGNEMVLIPYTDEGVTVPAGFIFDGCSTPRVFWWLIPPYKGTKKAAVVHDYICKQAKTYEERRKGDLLFRKLLQKYSGFPDWMIAAGYYAVSAFSIYKVLIGELDYE